MRSKIRFIMTMIVMAVSFFGMTDVVNASNTGANFTVTPVYPANQVGGKLGYFQLKVKSKQQDTISIKVQNFGNESQTFTITPTKAFTNDSGQIDYTPSQRKLDASAQYALSQLLSAKQTVTIPARTSKTIRFKYQIPANGFKGILLGGFYVHSDTRKTGQNANVTNRYAMVIGISMSEDTPHRLPPDISVGKAEITNRNDNIAVQMRIHNTQPTYFRGMKVETKVTKRDRQKVIYRQKMTNGSMAPTSNFDYVLAVGNKILAPGDYTAHMTIKAATKTWHFDRNFSVSPVNTAKQLTHANRWGNLWWLWLLLLLLILVAVGSFFYWLGSRKNRR